VRATIKRFRIPEVVLMSGFALIGTVHGWSRGGRAPAALLLWFVLGVLALFLAIYSYNSSADHAADAKNPRLHDSDRPAAATYRWLSMGSLVTATGLLAARDVRLAFGGVLSFGLWALYSHPVVGLKRRRGAATAVHVLGELLHFAMGSAAVGVVDAETHWTSAYFALLFAAGHLFHEVIDLDADRAAGVATTAGALGARAASRAAHVLFGLAAAYLCVLFVLDVVRGPLAIPFLTAGVVHVALAVKLFRSDAAPAWTTLRARYRACYFVAGLVFVSSQVAASHG
jgi:4-hydroxybenzoate polyprenyltransferase